METTQVNGRRNLLAGRFEVRGRLGEGGFGFVDKVLNVRTKAHCALKQLLPGKATSADILARFHREAEASGLIDNPHIVQTYDAATLPGGEPYVLMELLEGETLARRIAFKKQLDLHEICHLIAQACDGVQAAHNAGIIHRDLKPANLFITEREREPFIKLLDFGIAKFKDDIQGGEHLTNGGDRLGTPCYMSPEQTRDSKNIDHRSDVYTLGVILYECAAGKPPFRSGNRDALFRLIQEGKPQPLERLRPGLPPEFYSLVVNAMATDPHRRIATAAELAIALREIASQLTVENGTTTLHEGAPPEVTSDIPDIVGRTGALERRDSGSLRGVTVHPRPPGPSSEPPGPISPSPRPVDTPHRAKKRRLWPTFFASVVGGLFAIAGHEIATGTKAGESISDSSNQPPSNSTAPEAFTNPTSQDGVDKPPPETTASSPPTAPSGLAEPAPKLSGPTLTIPPKNDGIKLKSGASTGSSGAPKTPFVAAGAATASATAAPVAPIPQPTSTVNPTPPEPVQRAPSQSCRDNLPWCSAAAGSTSEGGSSANIQK